MSESLSCLRFGYLADPQSVTTSFFDISPLPDLLTYDQIEKSWPGVEKGWIHPPIEYATMLGEKIPLKPTQWFGLVPSHSLTWTVPQTEQEFTRFVVLAFGFLNGLHLVPEGWGYLRKTAIQPGKLAGFTFRIRDLSALLELMVMNYQHADITVRKMTYSLVHWFLMSQCYDLDWDKFAGQYQVSDLAFKIACDKEIIKPKKNDTHARRIEKLCNALGIIVPEWAQTNVEGKSLVAEARNKLFHEAEYGGQSIGMGYPEVDFAFQLTLLNEFFVLHLVGLSLPIVKYPNSITRMHYLLEVSK